jgi:predicted DsbA family dithiol-disulfide isomerase
MMSGSPVVAVSVRKICSQRFVEVGMKVEIWSDVVCPWCYIGKRRFETALAGFAHRDEVEVVWRSFELDPSAPRSQVGDPAERLAAKYGMSRSDAVAAQANLTSVAAGEGLDFHLASARSGNSFDAHRLIHFAAEEGRQDEMKERLFAGYLVEERPIGDRDTLVALAGEVGVDIDRAAEVLATDAYADVVRGEEAEAMELGISGVPFFVIDRTFGVSGAQPAETLGAALAQAWDKSHPQPLTMVSSPTEAGTCDGDGCTI